MINSFRDITGLSKLLKILLVAGKVWAIVMVISSALQLELISRDSFSEEEGAANDAREQIVAILYLLLYIFTAVIFGRWIYRANKNVRALGALGLRYTPGWAVGFFFVPIVGFWYPYQAMKDLWRASRDAPAWESITLGAVLGPWWTLWIIDNILGQISFRLTDAAKDVPSLQTATVVNLTSNVIDIPLCVLALVLVSQIQKAQTDQQARIVMPAPAVAI